MLKLFFKERINLISLGLAALFVLVSFLLLIVGVRPGIASYVIHYKALSGIDLFGSYSSVFYLIFAGIFIFALNFLLSFFFFEKKEKNLSRLLAISLPVLEFVIFLSCLSLVYINK